MVLHVQMLLLHHCVCFWVLVSTYITEHSQVAPTEEEVAAMRTYDGTLHGLAPPEKVPLDIA